MTEVSTSVIEDAGSRSETNDSAVKLRVEAWLAALGAALASGDAAQVQDLFEEDSHWRDLISLTWKFTTVSGASVVAKSLVDGAVELGAADFRLSANRTAPRITNRILRDVVEAFFEFDTSVGTGQGIVRFGVDQLHHEPLRAWTIFTSLRSLHGSPTPNECSRPEGPGYSRWESNDNWADRRRKSSAFVDQDPEVVVVGAGQAGLMMAAHLDHLGVKTLVVEANDRVGDNWRNRYHALVLHNLTDMVQMPYMPFPDSFPEYLPKDVFANWLEAFAVNMNINTWLSTEFLGGHYDEETELWTVRVRRADRSERVLKPRHVVIATGGAGGQPSIPQLPGLDEFAGDVVHSSRFTSGRDYAGRNALVVGAGTSGHDIAFDLQRAGCAVTIMQRGPMIVVSLDAANSLYTIFADGTPTYEADIVYAANFVFPITYPAMKVGALLMAAHDKDLHDSLRNAGMKLHNGIDGAGFAFQFIETGGGYYIDVGASKLIADGEITIAQADELVRFDAGGAHFADGSYLPLDIVVMATGYKDQGAEARRYFGDLVAQKIGDVSRMGDDGEIRNAWKATAQKGLWFIIGGVALARTYSPVLALQIKAAEEGLLPGYSAFAQSRPTLPKALS